MSRAALATFRDRAVVVALAVCAAVSAVVGGGAGCTRTPEEQCQAGDAARCHELGRAVEDSDAPKARAYFAEGCRFGLSPSCAAFEALSARKATPVPQEIPKVKKPVATDPFAALVQPAPRRQRPAAPDATPCVAGDLDVCRVLVLKDATPQQALQERCQTTPDACVILAHALRRGAGVEKDNATASALYTRACENDQRGEACAALGFMLRRGYGLDPSEESAQLAYKRACDLGYRDGCHALVDTMEKNAGCFLGDADCTVDIRHAYAAAAVEDQEKRPPPDEERRVALRSSCDKGASNDCFALAMALDTQPKPGAADLEEARTLFRFACSRDHIRACAALGWYMWNGRGGFAADAEGAATILKKACDGQSGPGCVHLATALYGSDGLAPDATLWVQLNVHACGLGSVLGCNHAGWAHIYARGVPYDLDVAERYLQQAARVNLPEALSNLGLVHARRHGEAAAAPYFVRACRAGHTPSCQRVSL
jgi:TPR repeat protein